METWGTLRAVFAVDLTATSGTSNQQLIEILAKSTPGSSTFIGLSKALFQLKSISIAHLVGRLSVWHCLLLLELKVFHRLCENKPRTNPGVYNFRSVGQKLLTCSTILGSPFPNLCQDIGSMELITLREAKRQILKSDDKKLKWHSAISNFIKKCQYEQMLY
jgi:hypothetical protein